MAATDKPFRSQRVLDIVFGVSNLLMLISIVWMLWQDHFREYKTEQRVFRDVESALAQRIALKNLPSAEEFDKAEKALTDAVAERQKHESELAAARAAIFDLRPQRERAEANFQAVNADVASIQSFLSIALEHRDDQLAQRYRAELEKLNAKLEVAQAKRDEIVNKMKAEQQKIDAFEGPVTKATAEFKKVNDKLDAQIKLAINKQWGWGDWFRSLPVIDGFASPVKIHQFTIKDVTIDYNFAQVPRYDRCVTCHVGIDRPDYTRENLEALTQESDKASKLTEARELYDKRVKALAGDQTAINAIPNPHKVSLTTLSDRQLTPSRIREFTAHPRLDLFVGPNSKHPAERFGCTSCHYGQGSGTTFIDASHSPNDYHTREAWHKSRSWEPNHMWDFPMLSSRFTEASCIKCHHEVTDLVSSDGRNEAPKVMRGYNLIRENGCFGCHEISGWKSGNRIGPDMRLEPGTPLEVMHAIERDRAVKDTDNRPGNLRKVGPALNRVSEKVSKEWMEKWIRSPASFRPDTKMPHYYGLSTNSEDFLREEHKKQVEAAKAAGTEAPASQERFPNTEIASIAHFLNQASKQYLFEAEKVRDDDAGVRQKDDMRLVELLRTERLDEKQQKELNDVKWRIRLRKEAKLTDLVPNYKGDKEKGRVLFTERGCLACHTHRGTESTQGAPSDDAAKAALHSPSVTSEAVFGPSLSQLPAKLGTGKEDRERARVWLIQWILNPQMHSPRSRMPVTHLTPQEAADVAAWLLNQEATDLGEDWEKIKVDAPKTEELRDLAKVYLIRMLSRSDTEKFVKGDLAQSEFDLIKSDLTKEEQDLYPKIKDDNALKFYLGKKAVGRLGCYGCHDIPGFENAKPIGVGLNDWGKKPADRLAFEDIGNYFEKHYYAVDSLTDKDGKAVGTKEGKQPYEKFFSELLVGHGPHRTREGYLFQKLHNPRSYDYNRVRSWDDRARMPQFQFSRPRKKQDEKPDDYRARIYREEAEAREAVATFVLGLTAEQVPVKSINQPTGDRMAEVKGRQILEKYNCNGCHLIRPGVYDFKVGPETFELLESTHLREAREMKDKGEILHLNHINWIGRNSPFANPLTMFGNHATVTKEKDPSLEIRLAEALRFAGKDGKLNSIPAGTVMAIMAKDLDSSIKTQADLERKFPGSSPFGGYFADLMVPYLQRKDRERYKEASGGGSGEARASLPPSLIGQGERTQSDWLYQFLLDPHAVRKMSILRMPKFNMSAEEASALVEYFTAVTRQTNPGIGLPKREVIPAQADFTSDYWTKKTADYIAYLKRTKEKTKEGKDLDTTLYQKRLKEYEPIWEEIRKSREPELKAALSRATETIKTKTAEKEKAEKAYKEEKDAKKQEERKKELDAIERDLAVATASKADADKAIEALDVDAQRKIWMEREAYAADGYRLLLSSELCTKCHQIGNIPAAEPKQQGPPLDLAGMRLRPDWMERWIDKPQRFVPYSSVMPPYFDRNELKYQHLHAGTAEEQIQALRDALLNYPRVSSLPVNRLYGMPKK